MDLPTCLFYLATSHHLQLDVLFVDICLCVDEEQCISFFQNGILKHECIYYPCFIPKDKLNFFILFFDFHYLSLYINTFAKNFMFSSPGSMSLILINSIERFLFGLSFLFRCFFSKFSSSIFSIFFAGSFAFFWSSTSIYRPTFIGGFSISNLLFSLLPISPFLSSLKN